MTDRYQPLRDAIAARLWPVGDSFQRNMQLVAALLEERDHLHEECHEQARLIGMSGSREAKLLAERDALREALKPFAAIPLEHIETPETFGMDVLRARAALADGEKG